jgi:hypothetical protein
LVARFDGAFYHEPLRINNAGNHRKAEWSEKTMSNLNLGIIGNCSYGALINEQGRYVWCPLPRFDGDPVFCDLLNGQVESDPFAPTANGGFFDIALPSFSRSEQFYIEKTAVLVTRIWDQENNGIEITDFAPRFKLHGRMHKPISMMRRVKPISGVPNISIRLRPRFGYGAHKPTITRGSNHVRYVSDGLTLRLTTNAPDAVLFSARTRPISSTKPLNISNNLLLPHANKNYHP